MGCEDGCVEKSSCVQKLLNPSMDLRSELRLMGRWGTDREEEKQEGVVTLGMTPRALAWVTERTELFLIVNTKVMIVNTKDDDVCRERECFQVWICVMIQGTRATFMAWDSIDGCTGLWF